MPLKIKKHTLSKDTQLIKEQLIHILTIVSNEKSMLNNDQSVDQIINSINNSSKIYISLITFQPELLTHEHADKELFILPNPDSNKNLRLNNNNLFIEDTSSFEIDNYIDMYKKILNNHALLTEFELSLKTNEDSKYNLPLDDYPLLKNLIRSKANNYITLKFIYKSYRIYTKPIQ